MSSPPSPTWSHKFVGRARRTSSSSTVAATYTPSTSTPPDRNPHYSNDDDNIANNKNTRKQQSHPSPNSISAAWKPVRNILVRLDPGQGNQEGDVFCDNITPETFQLLQRLLEDPGSYPPLTSLARAIPAHASLNFTPSFCAGIASGQLQVRMVTPLREQLIISVSGLLLATCHARIKESVQEGKKTSQDDISNWILRGHSRMPMVYSSDEDEYEPGQEQPVTSVQKVHGQKQPDIQLRFTGDEHPYPRLVVEIGFSSKMTDDQGCDYLYRTQGLTRCVLYLDIGCLDAAARRQRGDTLSVVDYPMTYSIYRLVPAGDDHDDKTGLSDKRDKPLMEAEKVVDRVSIPTTPDNSNDYDGSIDLSLADLDPGWARLERGKTSLSLPFEKLRRMLQIAIIEQKAIDFAQSQPSKPSNPDLIVRRKRKRAAEQVVTEQVVAEQTESSHEKKG